MPKNARQIRENAKPVKTRAASVAALRWDDLEVVLALGRAGTISGAATRLGVNTSTIARRLDAMEASHGVHLFDRTPAGVAATELAESLLPVAEAMEHAAADAVRIVAGRETEPEGTVRLTAPPGLANWIVAPALVGLRRRHPKLVLEIDASVGYADLTRREADLAMRSGRPTSGDLVAVRLAETASIIAVAPAVAKRLGKVASLDALDWITWGRDLAHLPDARWVTTNVSPQRIALRTSSMDAQLHAARAGLGAMLVARPFLPASDLVELALERALARRLPEVPTGTLWLVGHRALRNVPRVRAVWDYIVELANVWS
jgi:DNA-binding transcriptional LysR family regulator